MEKKPKYDSYIIKKELFTILENDRKEYLRVYNEYHKGHRDYCSDLDMARAYILGGKRNRISHIYKCENDCGGCGMMPKISSTEISKALVSLAKNNKDFMGIARVGQFKLSSRLDMGIGIEHLTELSDHKMVVLSLGRNGMSLDRIRLIRQRDSNEIYDSKFIKLNLNIG